ncbi:hypothetical protein TNCV_367801, partial [Trichonephila clavipes]
MDRVSNRHRSMSSCHCEEVQLSNKTFDELIKVSIPSGSYYNFEHFLNYRRPGINITPETVKELTRPLVAISLNAVAQNMFDVYTTVAGSTLESPTATKVTAYDAPAT